MMRVLAGSSLLSAWIAVVSGQAVPVATPQRFAVASIKPCAPASLPSGGRGRGGTFTNSPGSTVINCVSAAHLINRAFIMFGAQTPDDPIHAWTGIDGIQFNAPTSEPLKIRGGPAWVYTDKFSIEAKAAGGGNAETMMGPMLRSLLEERFRLKLHQQTEAVELWALNVARGGPRFQPAAPGSCIPLDAAFTSAQELMAANPGKPFCGRWTGNTKPSMASWKLSSVPVAELCTVLGLALRVPVIDRTGLTGLFNFAFEYGPGDNSAGPTIFSAVQDQLGLTLVKTKGPRGFLVIDQIERPTPDGPAQAVVGLAHSLSARAGSTEAATRAGR